jgi:DNA repair exonuclease SbcCD ATPase subunit
MPDTDILDYSKQVNDGMDELIKSLKSTDQNQIDRMVKKINTMDTIIDNYKKKSINKVKVDDKDKLDFSKKELRKLKIFITNQGINKENAKDYIPLIIPLLSALSDINDKSINDIRKKLYDAYDNFDKGKQIVEQNNKASLPPKKKVSFDTSTTTAATATNIASSNGSDDTDDEDDSDDTDDTGTSTVNPTVSSTGADTVTDSDNIDNLKTEFYRIRDAINKIYSSNPGSQYKKMDALVNTTPLTVTQVKDLTKNFNDAKNTFDDENKKLSDLTPKLTSKLESELKTKPTDTKLKKVLKDLNEFNKKIKNIVDDLIKLKEKIDKINAPPTNPSGPSKPPVDVANLKSDFDLIKIEFDKIESDINKMNDKVTSHTTYPLSVADITTLKAELTAAELKFTNNKKKLNGIKPNITSGNKSDTKISNLQTELSRLETKITTIEASILAITPAINGMSFTSTPPVDITKLTSDLSTKNTLLSQYKAEKKTIDANIQRLKDEKQANGKQIKENNDKLEKAYTTLDTAIIDFCKKYENSGDLDKIETKIIKDLETNFNEKNTAFEQLQKAKTNTPKGLKFDPSKITTEQRDYDTANTKYEKTLKRLTTKIIDKTHPKYKSIKDHYDANIKTIIDEIEKLTKETEKFKGENKTKEQDKIAATLEQSNKEKEIKDLEKDIKDLEEKIKKHTTMPGGRKTRKNKIKKNKITRRKKNK